MSFKYFAYGSNLCQERMRISNPKSHPICIGELNNYKLSFGLPPVVADGRNAWMGGAATIIPKQGEVVWGLVYEVDNTHSESLDQQEFCYRSVEVPVVSPSKETHICRTYTMEPEVEYTAASPQYLKVILTGAKQNNLPPSYFEKLEKIESNKNTLITSHMRTVFRSIALGKNM